MMFTGILMFATLFGPYQSVSNQIKNYPLFKIVVHQEAGQVSFEFYREKSWWLFKEKVPVSVNVLYVYLPGGNQILWQVMSRDKQGATSKIIYGVLPQGFSQVMPERGLPEPLKKGQEYRVSAEGEGISVNSFIYEGP